MRSSLGRFHRPFARVREEQLLLLNDLGDGSTLSLDFTTGILDPRLTFTRTTNATFINSSGLVEWAAANMLSNSVWTDANATPTNWTLWTASGGSVSIPESGLRTVSASAASQQPFLYQNYALSQGLAYTLSVVVTAVSGTVKIEDVLAADVSAPSIVGYYIDGVLQSNTANQATTGKYAFVFVASAASHSVRYGVASKNLTTNACSITMHSPRLQPGQETNPSYVASPVGSSYQGPRFDYDPTAIGTPRGLLIEGSSDNQVRNSNDIYNASFWGSSVGVSATRDTTIPDPSGGTTTCKIVKSAGVQYVVRNQPLPTLTVPANSTVNLTASVWLRMDSAGQVSPHLGIYDAAGASFGTRSGASVSNSAVTIDSGSAAIAAYTFGSVTGWVRCSVSRSFTNSTASPVTFTQLSIYIYPNQVNTNAATIYAWGAQVEPGVGASSLIPSGSSTGFRAADSCVMTGTNFSSWFAGATEGVLYAEVERPTKIASPAADHGIVSTLYTSGTWLGLQMTATNQYPSSVLWPSGGFVFAGGIATRVPLVGKQAVRWFGGNDITNFANGVQGATSAGTGTMVPTLLTIGANISTGTTANLDWLNGCIRRVKFWPTALPNAQIIALTT